MATFRFDIEGMTCGGCAARAEKAMAGVPGVASAAVNFANHTATVEATGATAAQIAAAVTKAGYPATTRARATAVAEADTAALGWQVVSAAVLTLPIFVVEMGGNLFPALNHWIAAQIGLGQSWTVQFVLASLVLIGPGRVFYRLGVPALMRGAPDMNALVVLGATAAWAYSTVATFAPAVLPQGAVAVYFEAAAVIVTLIMLGRWLEGRAKGRTGAAIKHLIGVRPDTARIERDGAVVEVTLASVQVGDVVHIPAGARVPMDGVVARGAGVVDVAMLSGEPVPVEKAVGDVLTAGTIDGTATLVMTAQAVDDDLAAVAAAEAASTHPLAAAVLAEAGGLSHPANDVETLPGLGVQGVIDGRHVSVGNADLMAQLNVTVTAEIPQDQTPVYAAIDGQFAGALGVTDPIKEDAAAAVAALQARGVKVAMISGDRPSAAEAVGRTLGIDHVIAGVRPEGNVGALKALQSDGAVAFVGDGINDAPALAAADVGVAMGTGTDMAVEAADVVLMSGDPMGVTRAIEVSRRTLRNIWQNRGWAFGYNVILMPVAALAWLSPQLAALAMAASSVLVVTNALRLRWVKVAA
ncbi:heavy metal translocating P-type ATPase [Pseudooctadecabacter sp.]|uniref:heavy metal translocating P-type ATPase n=1 Tax=Pseudooctadecabacter sp. TaxID=1966338 RepID=UPI0035C7D964